MAISWRSSSFASSASTRSLFLSRPFPPEPSQNTSRPYCYHQRVAMTTEAGTGEGIQQVNAKALIYTRSHTITVDDASFMNL